MKFTNSLNQQNVTKTTAEAQLMDLKFRVQYLTAVRARYYKSRKLEKTKILNELCSVAGYNRKYAIRIMAISIMRAKNFPAEPRSIQSAL